MTKSYIYEGTEFQVNTHTDSLQFESSITGLSDGGYLVVWTSLLQDGSGKGIYAQRYNDSGVAVGEEFRVNTFTTGDQTMPSVASLKNGGFVVTWASNGQDGSEHGIYAQQYNASGVAVGDEFLVNTITVSHQIYPSVAGLSDGGYVVTWSSYHITWSDVRVFGQKYDSDGNKVGSAFFANTISTSQLAETEVTALVGGGFVVCWPSASQDGSGIGSYAQIYGAEGARSGVEFRINTHTADHQYSQSITSLADGGFVVTWQSNLQDGDLQGIYGQRYDASGAAVGAEFLINTTTEGQQREPDVCGLADGGFVIVWHSNDGHGYGIYAQRFDAEGVAIGVETLISTNATSSQSHAKVSSLEDGGFVVSWNSFDQDGDDEGIFAQQFAGQLFGTSDANTIVDTVDANWIDGQGGNDVLKGLKGADTVFGGAGRDTLLGGGGADKLFGGSGRDALKGGSGTDILKGQGGKDRLTGGNGQDTMSGGGGADRFIFRAASESAADLNADIIKDFEVGIDHIVLSALGVAFIGTSGFSGAAEVRITEASGDTLVQVDTDGDGSADMKIVLEGAAGLSAEDFIL